MPPQRSIFGRALLALILMVCFYLLAMAVVGILLCLPFAEMAMFHRVHFQLGAFCLGGAWTIAWAIFPRFDRFTPPGQPLTKEQHPRLFEELESVAKSVNQPLPAEIYLLPENNAAVTERGGMMGIGSRRVMFLGVPLMGLLTRAEFRAVLAHEFGHYHGGDTSLGQLVYKTRSALLRTMHSLGEESLLHMPFHCYNNLFMRITFAVSRHEEFLADALAARAQGASPLISALRKIQRASSSFADYFRQECAPVLGAGFLPPIVGGYHHYLSSENVTQALDRKLQVNLKYNQTNIYDSHPNLRERTAALKEFPVGPDTSGDDPALSLLDDLPQVERTLLAEVINPKVLHNIRPITWEQTAPNAFLPGWIKLAQVNSAGLTGITPDSLPRQAGNLKGLGSRLRGADGKVVSFAEADMLATNVVGAALTVRLVKLGATVSSMPGETIIVTRGATSIRPFDLMPKLAKKQVTEQDWLKLCQDLGISGLDLGKTEDA